MKFLIILAIIFLGLLGGQKLKGARRFGIPGVAFLGTLGNGFQWKDLICLLFIPIFLIGYGQGSWLYGLLGNDTLVRVVYGAMLAIPFIFFGFRRFLISLPIIMGAFSLKAGSLGSIGGFDFLIEDIVRYSVLAVLIFVFIIKEK